MNGIVNIDEELVFVGLSGFNNKEEILKNIAEKMVEQGYVKESFTQAILDREKIYPTGLQSSSLGVAIPHTDSEHVNSQAISIATLKEPVTFIHMGSDDIEVTVKIIFMLAIKNPKDQLTLLQKFMDILQKEEVLNKIANSEKKYEVIDLLKKELQ